MQFTKKDRTAVIQVYYHFIIHFFLQMLHVSSLIYIMLYIVVLQRIELKVIKRKKPLFQYLFKL